MTERCKFSLQTRRIDIDHTLVSESYVERLWKYNKRRFYTYFDIEINSGNEGSVSIDMDRILRYKNLSVPMTKKLCEGSSSFTRMVLKDLSIIEQLLFLDYHNVDPGSCYTSLGNSNSKKVSKINYGYNHVYLDEDLNIVKLYIVDTYTGNKFVQNSIFGGSYCTTFEFSKVLSFLDQLKDGGINIDNLFKISNKKSIESNRSSFYPIICDSVDDIIYKK